MRTFIYYSNIPGSSPRLPKLSLRSDPTTGPTKESGTGWRHRVQSSEAVSRALTGSSLK
jgi:hypothetical protein